MYKTNELNIDIGKRIRSAREAQNKTREQIAEAADISSQFLFEIETGKKSMTARTIINIAKSLNISTDYLLLGELSAQLPQIFTEITKLPKEEFNLTQSFLKIFLSGVKTVRKN